MSYGPGSGRARLVLAPPRGPWATDPAARSRSFPALPSTRPACDTAVHAPDFDALTASGVPLLKPGQNIASYRLLRRIGEGAMGEVWAATREGEHGFVKEVALKLTHLAGAQLDAIQALIDEGRNAALIRHPNVVDIYDLGQSGEHHFVAMELIQGADLQQCLRQVRRAGRSFPIEVVIEIGIQTCRGLHAAHNAVGPDGRSLSLVHRDIKPSNLMLTRDGLIKVMDFGVARALNNLHRTATGQSKGTPRYMAPEQWHGGQLTPATDIFSLGAVLFELATGNRLLTGTNTLQIFRQLETGDPHVETAPLSARNAELAMFVRRCVTRDPLYRYQSARDLERDLAELRRELPGNHDLYTAAQLLVGAPGRDRPAGPSDWMAASGAAQAAPRRHGPAGAITQPMPPVPPPGQGPVSQHSMSALSSSQPPGGHPHASGRYAPAPYPTGAHPAAPPTGGPYPAAPATGGPYPPAPATGGPYPVQPPTGHYPAQPTPSQAPHTGHHPARPPTTGHHPAYGQAQRGRSGDVTQVQHQQPYGSTSLSGSHGSHGVRRGPGGHPLMDDAPARTTGDFGAEGGLESTGTRQRRQLDPGRTAYDPPELLPSWLRPRRVVALLVVIGGLIFIAGRVDLLGMAGLNGTEVDPGPSAMIPTSLPDVEHTPPAHYVRGSPLELTFTLQGQRGWQPELYWSEPEGSLNKAPMARVGDEVYRALVMTPRTARGDLSYLLRCCVGDDCPLCWPESGEALSIPPREAP